MRRVQDSVHGLMEFTGSTEILLDVLRTPELQRLRRIRQLGLAHLVFPAAEHSRLAHSIGAAYLAVRFGTRIQDVAGTRLAPILCPTDEDVRDLCLAGLCHDLGHGPLSHAWEREIVGEHFDRAKWAAALGVELDTSDTAIKWHELVGQAFLTSQQSELARLLDDLEKGLGHRVARLLRGDFVHRPYLPRLLSSDIDVDRADFIMRDAAQCGVSYGRYDLPWILSCCTLGVTESGDDVIGFDERKGLRAVEEFMLARRSMYETVYHHKTVRSGEGLFALFLRRLRARGAVGAGDGVDANLTRPLFDMIGGKAIEPHALLRMDDFALWVLVEQVTAKTKDPILKDLGTRLMARDLFKLVRTPAEKTTAFLTGADAYNKIYDVLRRTYGQGNEFALIVDHTRFSMFSEKSSEVGFVVDGKGKAKKIRDHEAFRSLSSAPVIQQRLFVPKDAREAVEKLIAQTRH